MNNELRASTGVPQKQVTILTREEFREKKDNRVADIFRIFNGGNVGNYEIKKVGKSLEVNGKYFTCGEEDKIKPYASSLLVVSNSDILVNPHLSEIKVRVKDVNGEVIKIDINENGDIAYILKTNDGYQVKKTKKDEVKNGEVSGGDVVMNINEILIWAKRDNFFITEDGKVIVIGKQKGDEGFSFFIDGKKVDGVSNIHEVNGVRKDGDDTLYVDYMATNGVNLYAKIYLGEAVRRRGNTELAVTIAREATIRALESNAGLIKQNQALSEQVSVIGVKDGIISEQNRKLERNTREIERLNELLEILRTKLRDADTENGRLKSENQGLKTTLTELNTKIDGLVKKLEGFVVKTGGRLTNWSKDDESGLGTFIKSVISTLEGLKK